MGVEMGKTAALPELGTKEVSYGRDAGKKSSKPLCQLAKNVRQRAPSDGEG